MHSDFIRALLRQPIKRRPVWVMRQAGRYLPEYRRVRAQAGSFMDLCRNPELACEVTLQPLARFDLDAAILFSDILTVPDAMGLGLSFAEGEGPRFARTVRTLNDVKQLPQPDPEGELRYVMDAVRTIRRELPTHLPLIGFSGSPWTLATYMVEGGSSKQFAQIKTLLYQDPQCLQHLLQHLATAVAAYLNAQIAAGVDAVMLFDTWGGVLSGPDYETFSLYYMRSVMHQLQLQRGEQRIPCIVFTKGGGQWLESIAAGGCDAVGLDWTTDLAAAKQRIGGQVALQGNLDPCVLFAKDEILVERVREILSVYGPDTGHVFNLGHGILPSVDPDKLALLVETVHGS